MTVVARISALQSATVAAPSQRSERKANLHQAKKAKQNLHKQQRDEFFQDNAAGTNRANWHSKSNAELI